MTRFLKLTALGLLALLASGCNTMQVQNDGSSLARIQERGRLILGTSGNMPAMSQRDASGSVVGFDVDMARLMAKAMDVEFEAKVMPFDKLLPALKEGQVDLVISNVTMTPARNLDVAFVGPYLVSGKCFVTRDEALARATEAGNLNTPATRIAVLKGSTSEDFARALFSQATIMTIDDYTAGAGMVSSGQAGAMLTDYPICMSALKNNPDAGFVSVFSLLSYEPIGIALPPHDSLFINWTENFLDRLKSTGIMKKMGQHWLGSIGPGQ